MNWTRYAAVPVISFLLSFLAQPIYAANSLIANSAMEGPAGNNLPAHWDTEVLGVAPQFATDDRVTHGSQSSIRITAVDVTRAYVRSEPIEVAPGETIQGGVWLKWQHENPPHGHVYVVAEFTDSQGHGRIVQSFDAADPKKNDWQHVSGRTVVPANVSLMRLLLGYSYSRGTVWFDDARILTLAGLVARMPSLQGALSPALDAMPVTIMNRDQERGAARLELILSPVEKIKASKRPTTEADDDDDDDEDPAKKPVSSATAMQRAAAALKRQGAEEHAIDFSLDGSGVQRVNVPLQATHRGEEELYLLLIRDEHLIFGAFQAVHIPPPLVLEPPLPTHWVIEDGSPRFTGQIDLAMANRMRAGGRLRIDVIDQAGQTIASWNSQQDLPDGITTYSIAAPHAAMGTYKIIAHFSPRVGPALTAEESWGVIPRRLASVSINAAGYPVYDGHAIFPLGVFNGSLWDGLQAGGFTVSHAYNAVNTVASQPPDDLAAQKFLEESAAHGLKALFLIPRGYVFAGQWDAFRRRIRMFKNNPALLAWDEEEGIARGDLTPANFQKMMQILREEDPYHPIMIGDSRDTIDRMGDRSNFFPKPLDMGMWWWYPFPLKSLATGALQGDEGASNQELVLPAFLIHRNTDKPIWVGVQGYRHSKNDPYPTPTEYRAQAYAAICAGAKGLMWYGGGVTGGLQGDPVAAHWKDLQKIVKEISNRADFWMEPNSEIPAFEPSSVPMSVLVKRHDGRAILVAVNRSVRPAEITLNVPDLNGFASVLDENRRVQIQNGKLHDQFVGLGVHVYEFLSTAK